MKQIILILIVGLTLCASAPEASAWWWTNKCDQQLAELQRQLGQERQSKNSWQLTAFLLGIGCVVTLVAGAAIGSKGRRDVSL